MTWSPDAGARRDRGVWAVGAAAILAFQGLSMVSYAAILRPVAGIAIDLPVLGRAEVVYLGAGALAIVAAIGVALRRTWGRVLGIVSAIVTLALLLATASGVAQAIFAPLLPRWWSLGCGGTGLRPRRPRTRPRPLASPAAGPARRPLPSAGPVRPAAGPGPRRHEPCPDALER
jgi:hypothetical protein